MTLNRQLLLVSLLLLSLPWAGCEYLQEMDAALRREQQQTLQATAQVIAKALAQSPAQLQPHGEIVNDSFARNAIFYCHSLSAPVRTDGYFDEWSDDSSEVPWRNFFPNDGVHPLRYRCGIYGDQLALAFSIGDDNVVYNNPTVSLAEHGDRLLLATGHRDYYLTAVAPGQITPRYRADTATTYRESRIDAAWIDNSRGYQIEIRMPLDFPRQRLSFTVIDEAAGVPSPKASRYGPYSNGDTVPLFVWRAPAIRQQLATFEQAGTRLHLTTPQGWLTATIGSPEPTTASGAHWLLRKFYRLILNSGESGTHPDYDKDLVDNFDFSRRAEFAQALAGVAASAWYRDVKRSDYQILSSAVPVISAGQPVAVLLAEQSSEQTAALTDRAFHRLFALSLGVIAVTALALLSYASWLSFRIRRLSRATQMALDDHGNIQRDFPIREFPDSSARDEIGVLTRNYAELMKRIAEYTEYLQTLSRKLSHELRTPLAIIHSSLDNLAAQPLDATSQTYQQRARDGALRLGNILTAMSEARRVEESIAQAEPEHIDLTALLRELAPAYRDIYPRHRFETVGINPEQQAQWVTAVPDLLVQMLDKLMDNAASFCPPGATIALSLSGTSSTLTIAVSNDGPLLPATMQRQLFDNMVSLRNTDDDTVHLGLGLHIVRLIVEYHGGTVSAANREDQSGVIFSVQLPRKLPQKNSTR